MHESDSASWNIKCIGCKVDKMKQKKKEKKKKKSGIDIVEVKLLLIGSPKTFACKKRSTHA